MTLKAKGLEVESHPVKDQLASSYQEYREEVAGENIVPALRATVLVVVGLTATFPLLDWLVYPDAFINLLKIRVALGAAYACIWILAPRAPERAMLAAAFAEGVHLVGVIGVAGGVASAYYPGIILFFLGAPILLPLTLLQGAGLTLPLLAMFAALPIFSGSDISIRDYLVSMFFVGTAATVSLAGTFLLDRLRYNEHLRRAEVTAARDQLAELDQIKTRFSANVHHELRTPLTLMLAPLEGLRSGDYGEVNPEFDRTFRTMHVNGQRLLKLINNLLDLAKLESNQFEVKRAPVEIDRLISDLVDGATPMADRKGLALATSGLENPPPLYADADALEKILVNLLGNALKFTDTGGEVEIGLEEREGGIEIFVSDSGVGLDAEQLDRVFDRFAQVDESATRNHEGTGIGLSLAQELVELHGGRIWAESDGLGCGSTMRLFLPTGEVDSTESESVVTTKNSGEVSLDASIEAVEADAAAEGDRNAKTAYGLESSHFVEVERSIDRWAGQHGHHTAEIDKVGDDRPEILVTDDNADMRELITFILRRDFRVRTARNGREALEVLEGFEPDLIVSDIMMPEMSGTELCKAVKTNERLKLVPVMLVSSKAESEMKIEGLELGADDYVTKPFHPRELLARARSHAGLHRARKDLATRNDELVAALDDLRRAEAQLVHSERLAAVGEIAAGIAHEVNNPVNFALNATRSLAGAVGEISEIAEAASDLDWSDLSKLSSQGELLRERVEFAGGPELGATVVELAKIISTGLERTQRLVADLRDFAAPGTRGEEVDVDLRETVRTTVHLMERELSDREVDIQVSAPETLATVLGNPGAMNQIVLNLIKNSIECFDQVGGSVAVSIVETDDMVELSVSDNGPGMSDDICARVLEPFFTTKPAGEGTGLGLSVCRNIAEAHGGDLCVASTLGAGTVVTLSLPRSSRS